MKKVLHISKFYYPYAGGTEQIARDCVLALKGKYYQEVIAFSEDKEDKAIEVDGITVLKCGCFKTVSSQPLSSTYGKTLHNVMVEYEPDIIIFHYPNPLVAMLLLNELKKSRAKLVLYWHLDIIKQKLLKKIFYFQNKKLLKKADVVIATSPNYIEGSPWLSSIKEKCVVVPNCINVERMEVNQVVLDRVSEIRRRNTGKTICVAVGRHTEYKGFTYLVQASKLLNDKFEIFIIGMGELTENLKQEAEGDPKVHFVGRVDDIDLKALLLASDIFCFPSITKNEAFGLALAEAMYYEKPTVTFTIPGSGVNYVSLDGVTGIEVENRNVDKYAEAMETLATDEDLRRKYGKAAKERVVNNFLSTEFCKNILQVIGSVGN